MPNEKRWYNFTKEKIAELEDGMTGIYHIGDINKVPVYIGSSDGRNGIKSRLASHLRNKRCPKGKYFRYLLADTFDDPKQMEVESVMRHVRKYRALPLYIKAYPKHYDID